MGPIELSLFPRLAIEVSKVRLSEHGRADEFLAIDEAALAVAVLPLLRKQVVVDRISARGVRAVYTRDAKGVRNIDDLVGAAGTAAPAADAECASAGGQQRRAPRRSAVKVDGRRASRRADARRQCRRTVATAGVELGRAGLGSTAFALRD